MPRASAPDPWTEHMRRGEWAQAWAISDAALRARAGQSCTHWPRHLQYVWTGAPLDHKRVLVRCYHGLGDTLQFIRYAPLLKAIAAEVIVWAQPKLLSLLGTVDGIDRLLPLHDGTPEVEYDVDVEIMELAHVFRTVPDTVPGPPPYLRSEPMPLPVVSPRPQVGLVWKAGDWNPARSVPYALLAPFAQCRDIDIHILQPDAHAAGWRGEFGQYHGELAMPEYARAVRAMDLLITIDSMPAHLAGALGTPAWTLLHHDPDWRWMRERSDSPWYPGMRLFRQRRCGDWQEVIEAVLAALSAWIAERVRG